MRFKLSIKTFLVTILGAVAACLLAGLILQSITKLTLSDFHVYYYVSQAVLAVKSPMFPYENFSPVYPYFFPPASIILFWPLTLFPLYFSKIVWTVLNAALLLASINLITRIFTRAKSVTFLLLLIASLIFYPLRFTFTDGQFNVVLLFIFSLGFWALSKPEAPSFEKGLKRFSISANDRLSITAGIGLGVGVITKISPALILVYALWKKKFKLIASAVVTAGILSIFSEFFVKHGINFYYIRNVLSKVSLQSGGFGWTDQSLLAVIKRVEYLQNLHITHMVQSLILYAFVGLILLTFLLIDRKTQKSKFNVCIDYFILTIVGVTGTGLTWFHQFTILLLPLFGTLLLCIFYLKKHRAYFISSTIFVYVLWMFNLKDRLVGIGYGEFNMLFAEYILLTNLFILKSHQHFLDENNQFLPKFTDFDVINKKVFAAIFGIAFFVGLQPWNLSQNLKEARDKARVENISFMGNVLSQRQPSFRSGTTDSFLSSNRTDRGYILFKADSFKKVLDKMAILYVDPINNAEYNYTFTSTTGSDFELKAKMESKLYRHANGEFFTSSRSTPIN